MVLVFFLSSLLTDSLYIPGKEEFHSFPMSKPEQRAFADSKLRLYIYIYKKKSFLVVNPVALVFCNNISLKCKYCHQSFLVGKKMKLVDSGVCRLLPRPRCANSAPVGRPPAGLARSGPARPSGLGGLSPCCRSRSHWRGGFLVNWCVLLVPPATPLDRLAAGRSWPRRTPARQTHRRR